MAVNLTSVDNRNTVKANIKKGFQKNKKTNKKITKLLREKLVLMLVSDTMAMYHTYVQIVSNLLQQRRKAEK